MANTTDPLAGFEEQNGPDYTRSVHYRRGSYTISSVRIPYFAGNLLVDDLDKLKLVQELPLDYRESWRLDELYQRDIDEDRVESEIVGGYLRNPDRIIFFNSLTVALLPRTADGVIGDDYGEPEAPPAVEPPNWKEINCGGVQLCQPDDKAERSFGYLRWDTQRIFSAVIDGQHRLAALRRFFEKDVRSDHKRTDIPIIFLVFHPKLGCNIDALPKFGNENRLLRMTREIFIDLNKHARIVSPSRQILMDDQDIEARCIRTLIADRSMENTPSVLPLGAINWRDDSSKFDKSEHLTTLLQLRSIVRDLLDFDYPPPKEDPTQKKLVLKLASSMNRSLQIDGLIREKRAGSTSETFQDYVDSQIIPAKRPLTVLPPQYLRLGVQGFQEIWWPAILGVMRLFTPYARILEELDSRGGLSGEWARYNVWPVGYQLKWRGQHEEEYQAFEKHRKAIEVLKTGDFSFYSVFQRAIMKATKHIAIEHADVFSGSLNLRKGRVVVLSRWIHFLNCLYESKVFSQEFRLEDPRKLDERIWVGLAQNQTGSVQWTESAANRIASMLLLWWFRAISMKDYTTTKGFLKAAGEKKSKKSWPDCTGIKKSLLGSLQGSYKTKLRGSIADQEKLKKEALKLAEARLADLVELAETCAPSEMSNDLEAVAVALKELDVVMDPVRELLDLEIAPAPAMMTEDEEDDEDEDEDEDIDAEDDELDSDEEG